MDVTALCIRLLINMLILLVAQLHNNYCAQNDDAAFPHIDPNRLQFFEYDSISVNCTTELTVKRKLKEINKTNIFNWVTSAGSGTVKPAFSLDSGEYWCEDGEGLRRNAVNISVTAGSVILESPVLPVKEGDNVTLRCTKKKSTSDVIAEFYKDGLFIRTDYKGNLTIHNVSTSDEGLYKCNISGAGESPESRLAVRVFSESHEETPTEETPTEETPQSSLLSPTPTHKTSSPTPSLWWIVGSVLCAALLLLVLGVLYCCKHKGAQHKTEGSANRVSGEYSVIDSHHATYAVVKKQRKEKVSGEYSVIDSHHATYAVVKKQRKEKEPRVFGARTEPYEPEESAIYSLVN